MLSFFEVHILAEIGGWGRYRKNIFCNHQQIGKLLKQNLGAQLRQPISTHSLQLNFAKDKIITRNSLVKYAELVTHCA